MKTRRWSLLGLALAVSGLLLAGVGASLLPHLRGSAELVRLRNALLFQPQPALHAWTPASRPADFAEDSGPPMPLFAAVVRDKRLVVPGDDWATALAVGGHLLDGGKRNGSAIQSDLSRSYKLIVEEGRGYCGDYADVFTALAGAAGLHTRSWAFSFDGFGGRGHIFNEVWDGTRQRWVALDIHNNIVFVGNDGQPMSAIALRDALLRNQPPTLRRIRADIRPGYVHDERALDFYRAGLPEWYLWWGSAVQAYDGSPLVRAAAPFGRSVEQLAGVASGLHPRLRVLHSPDNQRQRESLQSVRTRLLAMAVVLPLTTLLAVAWAWRRFGRRLAPVGTPHPA